MGKCQHAVLRRVIAMNPCSATVTPIAPINPNQIAADIAFPAKATPRFAAGYAFAARGPAAVPPFQCSLAKLAALCPGLATETPIALITPISMPLTLPSQRKLLLASLR